jgi:transposase
MQTLLKLSVLSDSDESADSVQEEISRNEIERLRVEVENAWRSRDRTEAFLQKEIRRLEGVVAERDTQLKRVRSEKIDVLEQEIARLQKEFCAQARELEKANKLLAWFLRNYFGQKSEKTAKEKRSEETPPGDEPVGDNLTSEVKPQKRNRGQQKDSKGHGRTEQEQTLPTDETFLEPTSCACATCGTPYRQLEETEDSRLTEIEIQLLQVLYRRRKYVTQCPCHGKKIITASPAEKLYPKTSIGNSLWVHMVVQKFLSGIPTSRTLKDLSLNGFNLAQGTVTGGFKIIGDLLDPLYQAVVHHCRRADFWNADETSWRVFDSGKKRWWLWVIGSDDAVVYIVDPSRSKKVPDEFFAASTGTLMTDRFASYKALRAAIQKAWCWVHVRRDFLNIFNGVKKLKNWAKEWLELIAKLFVLNHKRFQLWSEGWHFGAQWEQAEKALKQHVQHIQDCMQEQLWQLDIHAEQKKALSSLKAHWHGLTLFLNDPRIPLHNNRAERLLRNAVILRKNSYGSGTEWSGHLTAKLFSIVQTWLINRLDPQKMLRFYFDECSRTPGKPPPNLNLFLPWTMTEKQRREFALPKSYSAPG